MSSVNKVFLIGNLGKDPEYKTTQQGTSVCSFSVATSTKGANGQEETSWHNITTWEKTADNCHKFLRKGSKVCVEGRLKYSMYEKDGAKVYRTDIVGERVTFLSSVAREEGDSTQAPKSFDEKYKISKTSFDGDIPF
mgnify:CR=1 FL=1